MNAFHVLGGCLAIWALIVSFLGITRENFPVSATAERLVGAISVVLVAATISAALITSAAHEGEEHKDGDEKSALVVPL